MGTSGQSHAYRSKKYWLTKTNAGQTRSDLILAACASTINDTVNGKMRNYFMKNAAVAGGNWREAMRNFGVR